MRGGLTMTAATPWTQGSGAQVGVSECPHAGWANHGCSHALDAGVRCSGGCVQSVLMRGGLTTTATTPWTQGSGAQVGVSECPHAGWANHDCSHALDAGVRCSGGCVRVSSCGVG